MGYGGFFLVCYVLICIALPEVVFDWTVAILGTILFSFVGGGSDD